MRVNYLLATWSGSRRGSDTHGNLTFQHLQYLEKVQHNLSQITIGWPSNFDDVKTYHEYMRSLHGQKIANTPVVVQRMENEGRSYGQYAKMYEKFNDFDYFIFMEDDYVPATHHFDSILVEMFDELHEKKNCGFLCGMAAKLGFRSKRFSINKIHAAISWGISHKKVLTDVVEKFGSLPYDKGSLYSNGQKKFSFGFTEAGYTIQDVIGKGYCSPYWNEKNFMEYFGNIEQPVLIVPIQHAIKNSVFGIVPEYHFGNKITLFS